MSRFLMSTGTCLTLMFACQSQPAADSGPGHTRSSATSAPTAGKPASPSAGDQYLVRIVPGETKVGEPGTSIIEVTPGSGFKMNTEFPTKLHLEPTSGVTFLRSELSRRDAEVSEKAVRFNVTYTPTAPGKTSLSGIADFSVCNEQTCKLIRGEKLTWDIQVR